MRKLRETDAGRFPPKTGGKGKFPGKPHTDLAPIMRGTREAWELVCKNLALIPAGLSKHGLYKRAPSHLHEDVHSIALHSLFYSAQRWDPEKGRFSTYAISDMRRCIIQVDRLKGSINVRTPLRRKVASLFAFAEKNSLSLEEAMQRLGISPKSQQSAYAAINAVLFEKHSSNGAQLFYAFYPRGEEMLESGSSAHETPSSVSGIGWGPSQEEEVSRKEVARIVRMALMMLPRMHRKVLEMHFGFNGHDEHNLEQIGRVYSLSRERIRQLKNEAFGLLINSSQGAQLMGLMGSMGSGGAD